MAIRRYSWHPSGMQGLPQGEMVEYSDHLADKEAAGAGLMAALAIANTWREWFLDQGFHYDSSRIDDCQGMKCREPNCTACYGDDAYGSDIARSEIGEQIKAFDAALAAKEDERV